MNFTQSYMSIIAEVEILTDLLFTLQRPGSDS